MLKQHYLEFSANTIPETKGKKKGRLDLPLPSQMGNCPFLRRRLGGHDSRQKLCPFNMKIGNKNTIEWSLDYAQCTMWNVLQSYKYLFWHFPANLCERYLSHAYSVCVRTCLTLFICQRQCTNLKLWIPKTMGYVVSSMLSVFFLLVRVSTIWWDPDIIFWLLRGMG